MNDTVVTFAQGAPRWLLLLHQLPPKPDYLRVKIRRRLQRVGAVPLKNAVYVLPASESSLEDFQWIRREIVDAGGDATLCAAALVEGVTDEEVIAAFRAERDTACEPLLEETRQLRSRIPARGLTDAKRAELIGELTKLRNRADAERALDFFASAKLAQLVKALDSIQHRVAAPPPQTATRGTSKPPRARTWVTRRGVEVDRIASAWLIRRFIDPEARFRFVNGPQHTAGAGEVRFDMYDAEYTHEGDRCTFEMLLRRFAIRDRALSLLGEIVHDLDCKDARFGRQETSGVASLVRGIIAASPSDETRIERGAAVFDDLYAGMK